jgi:hypothetical protein
MVTARMGGTLELRTYNFSKRPLLRAFFLAVMVLGCHVSATASTTR